MIAKHHGRTFSLQYLREKSHITRQGVSFASIADAAEAIGLHTLAVKVPFGKLLKEAPLPIVVHWNQNHFVVVYKITSKKVYVADPSMGLLTYSHEAFLKSWAGEKDTGLALLLSPTPDFYSNEDEKTASAHWGVVWGYIMQQHAFVGQLVLSLFFGSLFSLLAPFLTQAVVDTGIQTRDVSLITLILVGQVFMLLSRTSVEFIRRWILLHFSTRLNISLISDFLARLMRLPMGYFESKQVGDLMQRMGDQSRIQNFLSMQTLSVLFSVFNLLIFSVVLSFYHIGILAIFLVGSVLYVGWIMLFLGYRRKLDYKRFQQSAGNQSQVVQLITGMQEIKLHNAEQMRRWEWERTQAKLFKISTQGLQVEQIQEAGTLLINEGKNIFITFLAATAVIEGQMTLGMMMAIQYIMGQLNAPLGQMIGFMQQYQDAKMSLERLQEIYDKEPEDTQDNIVRLIPLAENDATHQTIELQKVTFQYEGANSPKVLDELDLVIPVGKVTAIVGTSGSGKTTLLKLLLKYYPLTAGKIQVGSITLDAISAKAWRNACGVVMQEGFIFSDTIARNIAPSEENPDLVRLDESARLANIHDLIKTMPLGWQTKIGAEGVGLSTGQKQRLLIARAIYKNPLMLLLDEATSALDAENEKIIIENLQQFYHQRTVVVIAHRLSTVKNADQIVVLEKGKVAEKGTHHELVASQGKYFHLVKNQLELGQ
jgi:ATP-binding cassette subfamily B protein